MDWSAVALLLAERADLPAVLVGQRGEVLLVASAAERALGWSFDSVGSNWVERHVVAKAAVAAQWLLEKALSGALRRFEVEVITPDGTALAGFEACSVGHDGGRGVLLVLEKLVPRPVETRCTDYDYEVQEVTTGVFTLRGVVRLGSLSSGPGGCCYQVLHGRSTHCEPCPLRGRGLATGPQTIVAMTPEREYQVTTAALTGADAARVSVRRLPIAAFSAVLQAKLDSLALRGRLSLRERDVLRQLVEGHTLEDIAEKLVITPRTVRFHQSNLLEKLGADSRADLMRLIF